MVSTPEDSSDFQKLLERIALAVIVLGCLALSWYHRIVVDTGLVPAIIDEYWVSVSARWINEGLRPYADFFQLHFPGSYYLYAGAERLIGTGMTALRAFHSLITLLLAASLFLWFRLHGRGLAASLGVALLVCGPCVYLWPVISPHVPGLLALVLGSLLLFAKHRSRIGWLLAGALLFFAGWTVQTLAVIAVATLGGALVAGTAEAPRRHWAPWVVAGAALPFLAWIVALLVSGQWDSFLRQAVLFVVDEGYKQAGGINDLALGAGLAERLARETGPRRILFAAAAATSLVVLWIAPLAALREWRSVRRALLLPALVAPLVFLTGRTDAHHAFYLCIPGLLILATPRWERAEGRVIKPLALAGAAMLAFVFFLATMPHLRLTLQAGLKFGDDRARVQPAIDALERLGVGAADPVAVFPWAANLYHHGVVPGHRFIFVTAAETGYHGEREWRILRGQMRASGTRWLAFYPASSAGQFLVDGRPPDYLVVDGTVPHRVGRSGPIELWRLE